MLQINQDPTNVACPYFAGASYAVIRQIMSNNRQVTNEQAVEQLTTAWNLMHAQEEEDWHQQVQADAAKKEELTRLA